MPGEQNNASPDERKLAYRWRHAREMAFPTPEVVAALTSELPGFQEWHAPEDDAQRIVKPTNSIEKSMQPMSIKLVSLKNIKYESCFPEAEKISTRRPHKLEICNLGGTWHDL